MATESVAKAIEIGRSLFGEHPADVIATVQTGSEKLTQLATLLQAIERQAGAGSEITQLAKLGSYVASDAANWLDSQQEIYSNAFNRFTEA